jgi:BASS family bile acid:Na+ symporter
MRISLAARLFPLWAVLGSLLAYFIPHWFTPWKPAIVPLLGIVMFGMGMTLGAGQ